MENVKTYDELIADCYGNDEGSKRLCALNALYVFSHKNGCSAEYEERDMGDRVLFVGTSPEGREYACGYYKEGFAAIQHGIAKPPEIA